jgi:hypothetical protein
VTALISTAPEYVWLVEENAFGVPLTTGLVVGTNQFLVPLIESNSFSMVEDPIFTDIPYGGGTDTTADTVADSRVCKGSLSTLGYPALTAFLLNAAVTRINGAQTLPWVTTEPPFDLVSFTAWHYIRGRDGLWIPYCYPGIKIAKLALSVSRADPKLKLQLDLVGTKELPNSIDSSTLPTAPNPPSEANYPKGPYTFSHTGGNVLLGGSALTKYSDLSATITNKLDPQPFESHWVVSNQMCGRDAESDVSLQLVSTSDLRPTYQTLTARGYSIEFNNGTHTSTINFNGNNYTNKLPYDLPLGKQFMQKATFKNRWDAAALSGLGADITVTST